MVASNLRLIAVKAASHKVVGLWIIDSCHRVVLVHVVSEAASLKLIIIFREIDFDGVFGFWGFRGFGVTSTPKLLLLHDSQAGARTTPID